MSGQDDNPTGSQGWNPEWFSSSQPFPSPETEYSAPPLTQDSGVPGGYRPYPIDEQGASDGRYGWTPESRPPVPSQTPTPPSRAGVRTPYSPAEMERLFKAYLEISEDAVVGTNQSGDHFWWRVSTRYNANRPPGTIERNESMVRNCIGRANEEIGKFNGYFIQESRNAGSGRSEVDIITAALSTYQSMNGKSFKYLNVWQETRLHPKYKGGITSSSSGSSKRSRSVALSDSGSEEVASQLAGANLGSPDAGPSGSQRRPQGRKKTAANRRRGATPEAAPEAASAPATYEPPPPPNNSLWMFLGQLNMADTSSMNPEQLDTHKTMIKGLKKQLGLLPPDA